MGAKINKSENFDFSKIDTGNFSIEKQEKSSLKKLKKLKVSLDSREKHNKIASDFFGGNFEKTNYSAKIDHISNKINKDPKNKKDFLEIINKNLKLELV